MDNMFKDLEDFGLPVDKGVSIYKNNEDVTEENPVKKIVDFNEASVLYDAKRTCPVCNNEFLDRMVKSSKVQLDKTDLDLRPIYKLIDPSKYDVVICNRCGYSALRKVFHQITSFRIDIIKKKIAPNFIGRTYPPVYDYDVAIQRYKLALYVAITTNAKNSEKAYICLKIAWLYRGKVEILMQSDEEHPEIQGNQQQEMNFLSHALDGFVIAIEKESFPTLDLDLLTAQYLVGELSRRFGKYEDSIKWLSRILTHPSSSHRLKERARDSKDLLMQAKKSAQ